MSPLSSMRALSVPRSRDSHGVLITIERITDGECPIQRAFQLCMRSVLLRMRAEPEWGKCDSV